MSQITSRIAELLFSQAPSFDFERTVLDLDAVLARICGNERRLNWDCEDVASFDMPGTRILLSLSDSPYVGYEARLVISVGPSSILGAPDQHGMVHASMCSRLVSRISERSGPSKVIWSEMIGVVTAAEVDALSEGIAQPVVIDDFSQGEQHCKRDPQDQHSELLKLRQALHPYGYNCDFPAATAHLAQQTVELAYAAAKLPMVAAYFAAAYCRAALD